jgi:hypothetical protein
LALSNDLLERIEPLDRKIETIAKTFPLVKLLKTMPVVGRQSPCTRRWATFNRFATPGKLAV